MRILGSPKATNAKPLSTKTLIQCAKVFAKPCYRGRRLFTLHSLCTDKIKEANFENCVSVTDSNIGNEKGQVVASFLVKKYLVN